MILSTAKRLAFLPLLLLSSALSTVAPEKAFVSVPVADVTVDPYYKTSKKKGSIEDYYQSMPFSGSWDACRRAHQLLFNEVVTVLEERGAEAKVQIKNFYFLKANETTPSDTFWVLKKNLTYFKNLKDKKSDSHKIPKTISYKESSAPLSNSNTITLKRPFYDPITKEAYSAGTRFILASDQSLKGPYGRGHFEAYIFDSSSKKIIITQIPKSKCIRNYSKKREDKIKNFVHVLKMWAYQKEGMIPYVLGGWSWTVTSEDHGYEVLKEEAPKHFYLRKKWPHDLKAGFDCMGIIGRAAQICDIPFYSKNTTTLLKDLRLLKKKEKLSEGDIIWYPGHVMVVSSLKNNLIIEAAGYERMVGKVQEVPVENIFKEAKTLDELFNLYAEQKPVTILCSDGSSWKTFKKFKILKISSIWEN